MIALRRRGAALLVGASLLVSLTPSRAEAPAAAGVVSAVEAQLSAARGQTFYVTTDKPLYHPGETVWFRAWEVAVRTLTSTAPEHGVTFQLVDPRGAVVAEKRVKSRGGLATNDLTIGPGMPGGAYTLRAVSELGPRDERPVAVAAYEVPRLKKSVEFTRASYAPGDTATALVSVERATGEPLTGGRVTAAIALGGANLGTFTVPIDGRGQGVVRFQVPPGMSQGNLMLTLNADAGGIVETLQKRVPVALERVDVKLFPEGGDLVAGLPSRVYLQARDEQGEPVETGGQVVDGKGAVVTTFQTLHDGMARFALTPEAGQSYAVRLARPKAPPPAPLPAARADGCVMQSRDDFTSRETDLKLDVACHADTPLVAVATLREKVLATQTVTAGRTPSSVSLALPPDAVGAVRVTLFDLERRPLAERLVYRGLGREVRVKVTADQAEYAPRDRVTLTVRTTDAAGKPVATDLALSVVDDAVLRMADSHTPHILSDIYLTPEMPGQTLFKPNFYFSGDTKAPAALDLVLGTQGWRRFAWKLVPR